MNKLKHFHWFWNSFSFFIWKFGFALSWINSLPFSPNAYMCLSEFWLVWSSFRSFLWLILHPTLCIRHRRTRESDISKLWGTCRAWSLCPAPSDLWVLSQPGTPLRWLQLSGSVHMLPSLYLEQQRKWILKLQCEFYTYVGFSEC